MRPRNDAEHGTRSLNRADPSHSPPTYPVRPPNSNPYNLPWPQPLYQPNPPPAFAQYYPPPAAFTLYPPPLYQPYPAPAAFADHSQHQTSLAESLLRASSLLGFILDVVDFLQG